MPHALMASQIGSDRMSVIDVALHALGQAGNSLFDGSKIRRRKRKSVRRLLGVT